MPDAPTGPLTIRCLAVDDEPLALSLVCAFIEQTPFLELAGRHASAVDALRAVHADPGIQLLFLDIQMPDLSGLELARILQNGPRVIFTTAYNQFALEGFRVDALDYLLKPFNYEEFLRAALKARTYFERLQPAPPTGAPALPAAPAELPADGSAGPPTGDHLYLRVEYQLVRVAFADIIYVEGLKDYVKVFLASETRPLLSLTSLRALEEKLPAGQFMRIHRSYIVNLNRITSVTRNAVLIHGETIAVTGIYREAFDQFMSKWR